MKIRLKGHEYRYAVEQMVSTLFPGEKPEYAEDASAELYVSLSRTEKQVTALCRFAAGGGIWQGRATADSRCLSDTTAADSVCQKIIKTAIYRAVLKSGYARPPWGALTGVRPGKLMHGIMQTTEDRNAAISLFCDEYDVSRRRAELCYETSTYTIEAEKSLSDRDICLYVGIPFCPTRCAYCSFVSQSVEKSTALIEPFFSSLMRELSATAEAAKKLGLNVVSIYFGGGTPTTLSAAQLNTLCREISEKFSLSSLREYTVEAGRPDTITAEKLQVLKSHGVDRVSVNPQTMRDSVLETIGRKHTAEDVERALKTVREVGGFAVNMDLIAGLPSDDVCGFKESFNHVLKLEPENITVHTLSLKRGSGIVRNGTEIPSPEEVSEMLEYAYMKLEGQGYSPYYLYRQKNMSGGFENTGWTKEGHVNLYNICMMEELCTILAVGGGASTKLIRRDGGKNGRISDPKYPLEYINQIDKICSDRKKINDFYEMWWK